MKKITHTLLGLTMASFLSFGTAAIAEYPEKPVEFVVPFPPGDLEDVLTRLIAEDFQAKYGQPAAVVNKPGGGGGPFPGAMEVAMAPADGYTVGSFVIGVPVVGPTLGMDGFTEETFDPLGIFLTYPFVIAASKDAPYQSMAELAAHAKDNDVALGHFGSVLTPTQVTLALAKEMDFEWGSDAAFDALDCNTIASGDADVINTTIQLILPCLDEMTILATVTDDPISLVPDAPTVGSLAPSLNLSLWNGLFVHSDTPADVREKIIAVAKETIMGEKAQQIAKDTGAGVYWLDAEASAARIDDNRATMETISALIGE